MPPIVSVYGLAVGAAALALWLDVRLGPHRPQTLSAQMTHLLAAIIALNLGASLVVRLAGPEGSSEGRLGALLLILVPCLLYVFLTALWLLRSLAGMVRRHSP